jgi:hypothetical protein
MKNNITTTRTFEVIPLVFIASFTLLAQLFADANTVSGKQTGASSASEQSHPATPSDTVVPSLAASPFYGTIWSYRAWNGNTGITEFRKDGTLRHYDGYTEYSMRWDNGHEFTLSADAKTILQGGARVWYRGDTPPLPTPTLKNAFASPEIYWRQKGKVLADYVFSPNGTYIEYFEDKKIKGEWAPWYGNVVRFKREGGRDESFFLSSDGNTITRDSDKGVWRKYIRPGGVKRPALTVGTSGTQPVSGAIKTTGNAALPAKGAPEVPLVEEIAKLNQVRDAEVAALFSKTASNRGDKVALESLKKRIGLDDVPLLKKVQQALASLEKNERFDVVPQGLGFNNAKISPLERDFWRIVETRDRSYVAAFQSVSQRFKPSYEKVLKRAVAANDLNLARDVKSAMEIASVMSRLEGTYVHGGERVFFRGGRAFIHWKDTPRPYAIEKFKPLSVRVEEWCELRVEAKAIVEADNGKTWKKVP